MIFGTAEQLWTHERVVTVHKQKSCYFSVVRSPATRTIWIMSLTSNASLMPSFYPFLSRLSGWIRLQIPPAGSQALSQHQRKCWSQPCWALHGKPQAPLHTSLCPTHQVIVSIYCSRATFSCFSSPGISEGLLDSLLHAKRQKVSTRLWGKLFAA